MKLENPIIQLQKELEKSNGDIKKLQCLFYKTSENIMNNYILQINDLKIELKELEFYFFDCEKHADIYVHQNEIQKNTSNFLYVHDSWGNRGGLDLTFGNGQYYGGILIRGIKIDGKYISGPAKLRNYIVSKLPKEKTINSYKGLQEYFYSIKNNISFTEKHNSSDSTIFHSTRFGLDEEKASKYSQALYKFIDIDYMNASPTKEFLNAKGNLETTKVKAISFLSGIFESKTFNTTESGKNEIKKVQNSQNLIDYIKDFKKTCI